VLKRVDHGHSVVGTPKTKRGTRVVPIDADTVSLLRRHQEMQDVERTAWGPAWNDAGLVFTREDGRPLRPEYATRHFQALAKQSGLRVIRLHDYADVRVMPMFPRTSWSPGGVPGKCRHNNVGRSE
jgi:integrase